MSDTAEPIRLVCIVGTIIGSRPWTGAQGAPEGQLYRCMNLPGGIVESENPVPLAARALLGDGNSPFVNFALTTQSGADTLFIGLIGENAGLKRTA